MRTDFEKDLEAFPGEPSDGFRESRCWWQQARRACGVCPAPCDEGRRILQAQAASEVRRRDFTNAVANRPFREDSPRFPQSDQGDLKDKLDRLIHNGVADTGSGSAGSHLGGGRPAEMAAQDRIAPFDRGTEAGLAIEQGAACALPESTVA